MNRWLEEYFAELETVFGLGLFDQRAAGGSEDETALPAADGPTAQGGPAGSTGHGATPEAGERKSVPAEAPDLEPGRVEWMLRAAEGLEIPADERYHVDAEPFLERELRMMIQEMNGLAGEEDAGTDTTDLMNKKASEPDEAAAPGGGNGLLFSAVLPPVLRMEQNRQGISETALQWEQTMLWKDAVPAREQPDDGKPEGNRFSLSFPQAERAGTDELVDEVMDELERRLMLEIGGAAEGRY